jgi:putative intracellular protease/amidase
MMRVEDSISLCKKEVVVDGNLVTSRQPSDLPAFMREIMKMICSLEQKAKAA